MMPNGAAPPPMPVLVGETSVVIHVLHFADGTANSTFHVTAAGRGHLMDRPSMLANMIRRHADELATQRPGLILPPESRGG